MVGGDSYKPHAGSSSEPHYPSPGSEGGSSSSMTSELASVILINAQ